MLRDPYGLSALSIITGAGLIYGGCLMVAGSVTIGVLATVGSSGILIPVIIPTSGAGLTAGLVAIGAGGYILTHPGEFDNGLNNWGNMLQDALGPKPVSETSNTGLNTGTGSGYNNNCKDCSCAAYRAAHPEECDVQNCSNPKYRATHPRECDPNDECQLNNKGQSLNNNSNLGNKLNIQI